MGIDSEEISPGKSFADDLGIDYNGHLHYLKITYLRFPK